MSGDINMTAKKGYTLIEILIVIALFSILLFICFPSLNLFQDIREKQEISEFKKDLLFARNSAIVENKRYMVYFNYNGNAYTIKKGENSPSIKNKTFNHGLQLNGGKEVVGSFVFTPSGTTDSGGTIYIDTIRNKSYIITLTPATGRIEIRLK